MMTLFSSQGGPNEGMRGAREVSGIEGDGEGEKHAVQATFGVCRSA